MKCATANRWKGGIVASRKRLAPYDTYMSQITFCEKTRRDPFDKKLLQVRCFNSTCKKWFNPTAIATQRRVASLNNKDSGDRNLYCSEQCKKSCSIFRQILYPKGFKNNSNIRVDQFDWAVLVKERDNYECQKCGATTNLIAHHIEGLNSNPVESADIDIGITLCKKCHKEAHKDIGCRFVDLTINKLCNEKVQVI